MAEIKPLNPFILSGYSGPEYFCNRKEETTLLLSHAMNGLNTTLLSIRRMGKSGLLQHAIQTLHRQKKGIGIYVDIYDTENLQDFTNRLASSMLKAFPQKNPFWKSAMNFLTQLRPVISYDELTGSPEVTLDYTQNKQYEHSLENIFSFFEKQEKRIVIALDEFQQITNYPEKNMEAMLRTQIQGLKNVKFIFSGSSQHLLSQMFQQSSRPFFSSTQNMYLDKIGRDDYSDFIRKKFSDYGRKINDEAIEFILDFTLQHTYYTQALSNRIFANGKKNTEIDEARKAAYELLEQNEPVFYQYRSMITSNQWNMLKAIAKEGTLYKPNAQQIIHKYKLRTSSSVQRNMEGLMNKEIIYQGTDDKGSYYRVYDCFLMRWLERM